MDFFTDILPFLAGGAAIIFLFIGYAKRGSNSCGAGDYHVDSDGDGGD